MPKHRLPDPPDNIQDLAAWQRSWSQLIRELTAAMDEIESEKLSFKYLTFKRQTQSLALSGTSQATAAAILADLVKYTGTATTGGYARLPSARQGMFIRARNSATGTSTTYPATGETINGGTANAPVATAPATGVCFVAYANSTWDTIP